MTHKTTKALTTLAVVCAIVVGVYAIPAKSEYEAPVPPEPPLLTHAQEVYKYALEWCESHGKPSAINPKDRDNTPSYGGYQFKPSTLVYYGNKYGVAIATSTMDYESQSKVVAQMIVHRKEINWHQQFPVCVGNLGTPPNY